MLFDADAHKALEHLGANTVWVFAIPSTWSPSSTMRWHTKLWHAWVISMLFDAVADEALAHLGANVDWAFVVAVIR